MGFEPTTLRDFRKKIGKSVERKKYELKKQNNDKKTQIPSGRKL